LNEANAVVVLFAGALGDLLLALPALRLLRRRHQAQRLVLGVRAALVPLARRAACADAVAALDDPSMAVLLGGGVAPAWWPERPVLYSWFGADDGEVRRRLAEHAADVSFLRVERGDGTRHAAVAYAAAVGESLGWEELVPLGRLAHGGAVAPGGAPQLVVHRGAGAAAKRWDTEGFAEVASWWRGRGGEVVDLLGPAEEPMAPLPDARMLRERPLADVVETLAGAAAYVGNDSGPSHLAGALGIAGVVLFGPTDPARWRPLSARLDMLRAPVEAWMPDGFRLPPARDVVRSLARAALP
jgi:ADP-heptose:LPS heptosyltransferase